MQQLAHPEGELAMAKACQETETAMGVSTMGTYSVQQVADACSDPAALMFQLYVLQDRAFTRQLVQVVLHFLFRHLPYWNLQKLENACIPCRLQV